MKSRIVPDHSSTAGISQCRSKLEIGTCPGGSSVLAGFILWHPLESAGMGAYADGTLLGLPVTRSLEVADAICFYSTPS